MRIGWQPIIGEDVIAPVGPCVFCGGRVFKRHCVKCGVAYPKSWVQTRRLTHTIKRAKRRRRLSKEFGWMPSSIRKERQREQKERQQRDNFDMHMQKYLSGREVRTGE